MARKREEKVRSANRASRKSQPENVVRCQQQNFVSLRQQLSTMGLALREIAGDG